MFIPRALKCLSFSSHRFLNHSSKSIALKNINTFGKKSSASFSTSTNNPNETVVKSDHKPTDLEKWILTWVKKYPKGQVPDRIPVEVMIQAKSRARIKSANYMTLFAVFLCIGTVISVKRDIKKGDSIQKRNEDWHKKVNEEYQAQLKKESVPTS